MGAILAKLKKIHVTMMCMHFMLIDINVLSNKVAWRNLRVLGDASGMLFGNSSVVFLECSWCALGCSCKDPGMLPECSWSAGALLRLSWGAPEVLLEWYDVCLVRIWGVPGVLLWCS